MGFGWDDVIGGLDKYGAMAEDALESGAEAVGQAVDSGLDAASGVARDLGADGVAEALDDFGDEVASMTGGAVDERELGQSDNPKELVLGEASAITEATTTLTELATGISSTGDALRTIDAADWTGGAADAFNAVFDKQPGLWHDASDAMTAAGQSLTTWSHTVEAAQGKAGDAIELWQRAEKEEESKKAAYNALSDEKRGETPLVDTWTPMFDEAREILRGARIERDNVAGQVSGALDKATALAPTEPPFTERWANNLTDFDAIADHAALSFGTGLVTGLTGIVQFVRQVNPLDTYNMTHPAEYLTGLSNLGTGIVTAAADPGAMVSAIAADARKNPFEFAGALTGDAILSLGTGGAGAGVAAARAGVRVADMAGDLGSAARITDTVADAGRHVPTPELPRADAPAPQAPTPEAPRVDAPSGDAPSTQPTSADSSTPSAEVPSPESGSPGTPDSASETSPTSVDETPTEQPGSTEPGTPEPSETPEASNGNAPDPADTDTAAPTPEDRPQPSGDDTPASTPESEAPKAAPDPEAPRADESAPERDSAPQPSPNGDGPDVDADPQSDTSPPPERDADPVTDNTESDGQDEPAVNHPEPTGPENPTQQDLADADSGVREAADEAGCDANQTSNQVCEGGDPVDVATGEFLLPETDLTLAGVLPLIFGRRHRSSYRFGRWFGPSWSTTVDMRVVVEEAGVTLLAEDGVMLTYAHPQLGTPTLPASGQLWPLTRTDTGGYRVHNPDRDITWHFAPKPDLDGLDTALGNLSISAITDRHRNRIRFHYGPDGAPTEISHSGGYRVLLDTRAGRITALSVVDADIATPVREFEYEAGHLTAVTTGSGGTTRYTYDDAGRMLSWLDDNGNQVVNTYDDGRVVTQRGTAGIMDCRFDYTEIPDGNGTTTTITDSLGAVTVHGFDNDLRLRDLLDPAGGHTHTDYNSRREPLRVVTPDGAVTRYLYTADGDVARIIRPDGQAVSIEYAGPKRPGAVRSADGSITRQEWDKDGNLAAMVDAAGARTQYRYQPNGTLESVTGPTGSTTFIESDDAGLPAAITSPIGTVTRILRDGFGRPESVIDPTGATTGYRWSPDGKLLAQFHPDGSSESWVYDGEGNLLAHTDTGGAVTGYEYGDFDLLAARTDPDGSVTTYLWDTERRLIAVTNPLGATWSYQYDGAGRLIAETDFIGATTTYAHDASGRVASVTPATGVARHNTYDILGRLTDIRTDTGDYLQYGHDLAGRVTTAVTGHGDDPIHTLDFEYTVTGQLAAQAVDQQPAMAFEYDASGRRTRRLSPTGSDTGWQWDPAGQLSALTTDGHNMSFEHDPRGALSGWRVGELAVTRSHTTRGQLATQNVTARPASSLNFNFDPTPTAGPATLREDYYTYRPDGYLTNHTTTSDAPTAADRVLSRDYTLDPAGRITTVAHNGTLTEQFGYDRLGNITDTTVADTTVADASDRREYHGNLLIRDGRTRYHYDDAGRLTRKTTTRLSRTPDIWRYRYNAFDQLVDVTTPDGQRWHYTYDALSRRTTKTRVARDGSFEELTRYTWDGTTLLEQTHTDTTTRWNYQPGTHTPITQATSQSDVDTEFYAIITDLVGTPVQLIEPQAADIAGTATADLWGHTTWDGASTPLRFPGQYHDPETGLHYNLHRYYNPTTARYVTQDPLGLAPAANPSVYPHNPTGWTDPLGLVPCPDTQQPSDTTPNALPRGSGWAHWGADTYSHGGLMSTIEHIMYRHGSDSGFGNVGHFLSGASARDIRAMVDETLSRGEILHNHNSISVTHTFASPVGTGKDGSLTNTLQVFVKDGWIKSAFPKG